MLRLVIWPILVSFFLFSAAAEDISFNLRHSSIDYDYGKKIDLLFSEFEKNQFKKTTIDSLATYQLKHHSFSILNSLYPRLKLISKIKGQDSFYKNCAIVSKGINIYANNIVDRLNISTDKYCRFLFLQKISALSSKTNFSQRDLLYFKEAAPFFSSGEYQNELIHFLHYFKTNTIEHEKLSNILIEAYIELKIKPSALILKNLKVSSQFNNFLQNNLNLDDSSNSYFQEEFQRLFHEAQDTAEKGDNLQAKIIITNALGFYNKNKNFINAKKAWTGITLIGKALFYKGKDADAIEVLNMAKSIAPKDEITEAIFYSIWPHVVNKDFKAIKLVIDKNNLEKDFDSFGPKLQYWIAWSILKTGDVKKATTLFDKIITTSPYSFYSIISLKEIALLNKNIRSENEILAKLINHNTPTDYALSKTSSLFQDSLKRLSVWSKIGNDRFATLELRYILSLNKEEIFQEASFAKNITLQNYKEFLIINLIRLLNSQGRFLTSFKIFQDSLGQNSLGLNYKLMTYIFPLNYIKIIKKNIEDLDPLLVMSLIRQESAFNPGANSGVGAKGLMQLMPETAKRFNRRIKASGLVNPEINLTIGIKYLKKLLTHFDGNLIFALASYNAGENRIDHWKKEFFRNDDPLSIIESIPYEETRNYVKLIYRNNFFYSLISNKPILMIPLEETFKIPPTSSKISLKN